MNPLEYKSVWTSFYKGVLIEIVHHGVSEWRPRGQWNYYVFIYEDKTAKFRKVWLFKKKDGWDYMASCLDDVFWHGGITYYGKVGFDKGNRIIKTGCDYGHLYDDRTEWTLQKIYADSLRTANELIELLKISP